jgi:trehalose 6-phosphate phosphatase
MRYLFDNLNCVTSQFQDKSVFLFLDYDGTITPIVRRPRDAVLSSVTREILRRLVSLPGCRVAVISGRNLTEIKKLVHLKNIIYAGNHGFQVDCPEANFTISLPRTYEKTFKAAKAALQKSLLTLEGVHLEDKNICLTVHYRKAAKKDITAVKAAFQKITAPLLLENKIRVTSGKRIFEIRPPVDWHKGEVVAWFLQKVYPAPRSESLLPVYIGDDITDEDAFRVLRKSGLTIIVGKTSGSDAQYFVRDTKEAVRFLNIILRTITKRKCH